MRQVHKYTDKDFATMCVAILTRLEAYSKSKVNKYFHAEYGEHFKSKKDALRIILLHKFCNDRFLIYGKKWEYGIDLYNKREFQRLYRMAKVERKYKQYFSEPFHFSQGISEPVPAEPSVKKFTYK